MHRAPKTIAPLESEPVRGNDPGTVTGSVVLVGGMVLPCSPTLVVVVVTKVVSECTVVGVVDVDVVVSSGTVVDVVVSGTVVDVVVSGTVVDVVVSGTVVDVEVDVEVEVDVDVDVDVLDVSGTVDEVVVVPWPPMQKTTWLMAGACSPPLSGGCKPLPAVTAGS
jgi:hypothetical protein